MNNAQIRKYWRDYEITRQRVVKKYSPGIYRVLLAQVQAFDSMAKEGGVNAALTALPGIVTTPPIKEAIRPIYRIAGASYARNRRVELRKRVEKDLIDWRAIMDNFFQFFAGYRITDITDTTRKWITDIVNTGLQEGLSYEDISRALMDKGLLQRRARMIARTEALSSLNEASRKAAEQTGVRVKKMWISALDARTRRKPKDKADHWVLHKQVREPNEAFSNGLQQPGDVNNTNAAEVVNCRCCIAWVPDD